MKDAAVAIVFIGALLENLLVAAAHGRWAEMAILAKSALDAETTSVVITLPKDLITL